MVHLPYPVIRVRESIYMFPTWKAILGGSVAKLRSDSSGRKANKMVELLSSLT
jgi:hypothetical protein